MKEEIAWTGEDPGEAPIGVAAEVPQSFESEEPHSKHSNWELIEYLSYTIAGADDLDWLLKMQTLGRRMQRFDP